MQPRLGIHACAYFLQTKRRDIQKHILPVFLNYYSFFLNTTIFCLIILHTNRLSAQQWDHVYAAICQIIFGLVGEHDCVYGWNARTHSFLLWARFIDDLFILWTGSIPGFVEVLDSNTMYFTREIQSDLNKRSAGVKEGSY